MIDIRNTPDPVAALNRILREPAPRVVVLGDSQLAGKFDNFISDELEEVVLAPSRDDIRANLNARGGERVARDAQAAAINATSGQVADVVQQGELVDRVRMTLAFARAES